MDLIELFRKNDLFHDLPDQELKMIIAISEQKTLTKGDLFAVEGEPGDRLCIIQEGMMEIEVSQAQELPSKTLTHLGTGQLIGEMSLVDRGNRSATVRAIQSPTNIHIISHQDFRDLCEENPRIGYKVMRNMAADLSFKLRHHSLGV